MCVYGSHYVTALNSLLTANYATYACSVPCNKVWNPTVADNYPYQKHYSEIMSCALVLQEKTTVIDNYYVFKKLEIKAKHLNLVCFHIQQCFPGHLSIECP